MGEKEDETKPDTAGADAPAEPEETKEQISGTVKEMSEEAAKEKSTALIDKAHEAAERMERANKKREALLVREEALRVTETLGGKAEAGKPGKEESPAEYAKKVLANDVETDKETEDT